MARQGNKAKLPSKEAAAAKVAGVAAPTTEAGFIVVFQGEQIKLRQKQYGSFKKLLQAAVEMQKTDPHFQWDYYDKLPE